MEYMVAFYDVGNCCVDMQRFVVDSIEELNEKATEYADILVGQGQEIAGWNCWDTEEDWF